MHDIDRAMFEFEQATETGELQELAEEASFGESFESHEHNQASEEELAAELLEVASEEEFEQFLGNLISSGISAARSFASSPTGQALGGVLKNAARQVLPQVGGILGNAVGGQRGAQVGKSLGRLVGNQFEGMSHEDREFEVAKAFVRTARDAARIIRRPSSLPPRQAANRAVAIAARRYMPGLARLVVGSQPSAVPTAGRVYPAAPRAYPTTALPAYPTYSPAGAAPAVAAPLVPAAGPTTTYAPDPWGNLTQTGRWVRRGNQIIILGA